MARYNREVEATLQSKFAFASFKKGGDHRWFELKLPGLPPIATKFSHAKQDIGDAIWKMIARQLRVPSNYLTGMIDCSNSREAYYQKVRTEPNPPWGHPMRETAQISTKPKHKPKPRRKK
jgi:hypothetical protein